MAGMAPQYYFTIAPMGPHPNAVPRRTTGGRWKPPKRHGLNVKEAELRFFQNGQATQALQTAFPETLQPFKQFSIYHDHACIWMVAYDATAQDVGDGRETTATEGDDDGDGTNSSHSADESEDPDWTTLRFDLQPHQRSYAGQGLHSPHLHVRRLDQLWAEQLLPDTYRTTETTPHAHEGGLNGELPLLIGLMSLTLPAHQVATCLPRCMGRPWQVEPLAQMPRGAGWQHRRGLVITVRFDPAVTQYQDLVDYERGGRGNILP
ncbi:hypothetical protein LTR53_001628 [Teratosphaeriaceae sp. CCFEE 6253]|nr:hypothetical protein LTR53_001628 [Teratosphaeriaceae sp. CCFEE 6253]